MFQIDTEDEKTFQRVPIFQNFMHFIQSFDRPRRLEHRKGSIRKGCIVQYA